MEQQQETIERPGHPVSPEFLHMLGDSSVLPAGSLVLLGVPPGRRPDTTGFLHRFFVYHQGDHFSYISGRVSEPKYGTVTGARFAECVAEDLLKSYGDNKAADISVIIVDFEGLVFDYPTHGRRALRVLRQAAVMLNLPIVVVTEVTEEPELKGCYQAAYRIGEQIAQEADLELFLTYHPSEAYAQSMGLVPKSHWKVRRGKFRSPRQVSSQAQLFVHLTK